MSVGDDGTDRRVLVLEPHLSGHHGTYLAWMLPGLVERGWSATLVTDEASLAHPAAEPLNRLASEAGGRFRIVSAPHGVWMDGERAYKFGVATRQLRYWRLFKRWYDIYARAGDVDVVLLPYLDYCLYAAGLLGSPFGRCPWVGIAMRPSFHYQEMGVAAPPGRWDRLEKAVFLRLLRERHLRHLFTIDEPLSRFVTSRKGASARVSFLPEPVWSSPSRDPANARRELGLPTDRAYILVYGAISARKGIQELLRAAADPNFPDDLDVVLAGSLDEGTRRILDDPRATKLLEDGRIIVRDSFVTPTEERLLYAAADIVWLGYKEHYGSSGVLAQAAQVGRPVLACDKGVIGWQTERYDLGATVSPEDMEAVIASLKSLRDKKSEAPLRRSEDERSLACSFDKAQSILAEALSSTPPN